MFWKKLLSSQRVLAVPRLVLNSLLMMSMIKMLIVPSGIVALVVKNLPVNAGDLQDVGLIPGSGRFPGGDHGNPL